LAGVDGLMATMPAVERLKRLLNLLPWLEDQGPEGADPQEVADRFGYPLDLLQSDLRETVQFLGDDIELRYLTAWDLFDIEFSDDRVRILHNDLVRRPLGVSRARLAEIAAVARSIATYLREEGSPSDELGPLDSAVLKLSTALGTGADTVQIHVLSGAGRMLGMLQEAIQHARCVEMAYYSYDRDEMTHRVVEPHQCQYHGFWYLIAHCRSANGPRVFRVDRISKAVALEETFLPPEDPIEWTGGIPVDGSVPQITLALQASARWVVDQYPCVTVSELPEGAIEVVLPIAAEQWLERLLLRLGPEATVVKAPSGLGEDLRSAAAARVLALYR